MIDHDAHKRLVGKVTCMWCRTIIKTGFGIIQFANGYQIYTHRKCLNEAHSFIYSTRHGTVFYPVDDDEQSLKAFGLTKNKTERPKHRLKFLDEDTEIK